MDVAVHAAEFPAPGTPVEFDRAHAGPKNNTGAVGIDSLRTATQSHSVRAKSVVVVGSGGNIGSQLVLLLARLPMLGRLTLIDPDRYGAENLTTQQIRSHDLGRWKVKAQARLLKSIRPELEVCPLAAAVEQVPQGLLRSDVIVAGLDSRSSRQTVNQLAWRLGVPWIDAGVSGSERLARVNLYVPSAEQPCLECAWSDEDYRLLEVRHACRPSIEVAATNAPAWLGSFAASLAAAECEKLLTGQFDEALIGRQVLVDARHHTHFVTRFRRNSRCRFDHRTWSVQPLDGAFEELRLGDLAAIAEGKSAEIGCEGDRFWCGSLCAACRHDAATPCKDANELVGLVERLRSRKVRCSSCGQVRSASGWELSEAVSLGTQSAKTLKRKLSSFGWRPHDIVRVSDGRSTRHFALPDYRRKAGSAPKLGTEGGDA